MGSFFVGQESRQGSHASSCQYNSFLQAVKKIFLSLESGPISGDTVKVVQRLLDSHLMRRFFWGWCKHHTRDSTRRNSVPILDAFVTFIKVFNNTYNKIVHEAGIYGSDEHFNNSSWDLDIHRMWMPTRLETLEGTAFNGEMRTERANSQFISASGKLLITAYRVERQGVIFWHIDG